MKIAVALSGGIDSASTALKFKREGHDIFGITMHIFDHQQDELNAAKHVAKKLGIPHHIIDLRKAFETEVITRFITAYESGETPNPCLYCNKHLKYGKLLDAATALGANYFATGHYAKVIYDNAKNRYLIKRADNARKDQSYILYQLNQQSLSKLILPLGDVVSKEALRTEFSKLDLSHSKKKDSQGICFIHRGTQAHFLKSRKSSAVIPGYFTDENGNRLGRHLGIANYTIGQKKGIAVKSNASYVVIAIDGRNHTVILGDESRLMSQSVHLPEFNFLNPDDMQFCISQDMPVSVKTSQWSPFYSARLKFNETGATIQFDYPVRGITKGQAIVCYQDDALIGGGCY